MTAIKLQTTIPVNFNCYILFWGLGGGGAGLAPICKIINGRLMECHNKIT